MLGIVAVRALAVERLRQHFANPVYAPAVRQLTGNAERAGIMEFVVREERSVVALDAARFVDEKLEAQDLFLRQYGLGGGFVATQQFGDIGVETGRARLNQAFIGGNGLAEIREHAVDRVAVLLGHRLPRGSKPGIVDGRGCLRKSRLVCQVRQRSEYRFVGIPVIRVVGDKTRVGHAIAAMLGRVLER